MHKENIKNLNMLLKGEYMAIEKYDHYIQALKDNNIKKELQNIQELHKKQSINLARRIQELGGNPVDSSGLQGTVSEIVAKISESTNNIVNRKQNIDNINQEILHDALRGESMGIEATNKITMAITDNEGKNIVNNIISENQNVTNTLNNMISDTSKF